MDRELLKVTALYYFRERTGDVPDTLLFTLENDEIREYVLQAVSGAHLFEIWMFPMRNRIYLVEIKHSGRFSEATSLAGMDVDLNNL
jgi:hypothetical protein